MRFRNLRQHLVSSTVIGGLAALSAGAAFAQDANQGSTSVQEVVVTGSRIPRPNLTSVSPVTSVNSEEVKLEGTTNIEDLINNLPQAFAEYGAELSNGASGTATVDLRGLGSKRTLVLIDGKRLQPGDPTLPVADLNFIPASLVDRVEVLTGGASSAYGSDAIAGVVNFIMKKNFEGLHIDVQYNFDWHNNDNSYAQGLLAQRPAFADPRGETVDGRKTTVTIAGGANSADGKGNSTFYFTYQHTDAVTEDKRDYTACALSTTGAINNYRICGGSSTSYPGRFVPLNKNIPGSAAIYTDATGATQIVDAPSYNQSKTIGGAQNAGIGNGTFIPYSTTTNPYNFAPSNYLQRPDERYTAGNFSHYQINKALDVYSSFMFMSDHTEAQIAPSGIFYGSQINIACNSPLLSVQQQNTLCGNPTVNYAPAGTYYVNTGTAANPVYTASTAPIYGAGGTSALANLTIGRRNVEGGGRISDLQHTDFREVIGAKGEIAPGWTYDVSAQYGESILQDQELNYLSITNYTNALNATTTTTCAVGGKCVPYNIFSLGGVNSQQLSYLQTSAFEDGTTTEQVVHADITGKLGQYGVQSPWAKEGVGINIGAEYRREYLKVNFDAAFTSGDLAGLGGAPQNTEGAFDVKEIFAEARIPIAQDLPAFKELSAELGYRRSDYSSSGTVDSYKYGVDWQIVRDIRLRGSFERAVRAPNINELYTPLSPGLFAGQDPCAGPATGGKTAAGYTAAQCALTGVSAGQFGNILSCSSSQCNEQGSGNLNLKPETSDTKSFGVVFTPTFVRGLTLTVDYFDIDVKGAISTLPATVTLTQCLTTGAAAYCNLIHRDPSDGALFGAGYVDQPLGNVGAFHTKGIDVETNYRMRLADFGLGDHGTLNFNFVGTYTERLQTTEATGATYDCTGLFGVTCGTPTPYWRSKMRVTWVTPWKVTFSGQWRFIGGAKLDFDSSQVALQNGYNDIADARVGSINYFDVSGTWQIRDKIQLRFGMNNIFDKDPPVFDTNNFAVSAPPFGNGNTYPQVYDSLGRTVFMGISADF